MALDELPLSREQSRVFYEWQQRLQERLPSLAARVFALRHSMYMGCGFHYAMEVNLGKVIIAAQPCEDIMTIAREIHRRLIAQMLFNDLQKAEKSAAEWRAKIGS